MKSLMKWAVGLMVCAWCLLPRAQAGESPKKDGDASAPKAKQEQRAPDQYGFIMDWLVLLDPIPLPELSPLPFRESSADKEFFPGMKTCTPKEGDTVKLDNNLVETFWKTNAFSAKPIPDVVRTWKAIHSDAFRIYFPPRHNSLYLSVTYITCAADIPDAKLKTGSGDYSVWLLNGKEIIRAVKNAKATIIDENVSEPVTLKKGVNVLMAENINCYGGDTGLCARFVDKDDKPVTNIKISLTPPAR
jgi:hypothetical protein